MKRLLFVLLIVLLPLVAVAEGPTVGTWAGTAFAGSFDLDGDGNMARTFDVRAQGQLKFLRLQGAIDAALVAFPGDPANTCEDPAAFELEPSGTISLRGWGEDVLFTVADPSVHLCFNPVAPDELLVATIIGGRGQYAGATGTATFRLQDQVLLVNAAGFPLVVDTQGTFTVSLE